MTAASDDVQMRLGQLKRTLAAEEEAKAADSDEDAKKDHDSKNKEGEPGEEDDAASEGRPGPGPPAKKRWFDRDGAISRAVRKDSQIGRESVP